jgi:uncharacterized protein YdhG (YjbR/CyaY superfamily)
MAEKKPAKKSTQTSRKGTTASRKSSSGTGFSAEERAAMKERAKELKLAKNREAGEEALLAAIAGMQGSDRKMAERIHKIVTTAAPDLFPRTWYGMPAYAKDDKVLCFFQDAKKFSSRYATFGFSDEAKLDKGGMWPTSFALMALTATEEAKIATLVKQSMR